jgi:L-amino acid N-acyltransferase YncA
VYTIREATPDEVDAIQGIDHLFVDTPASADVLGKAIAESKVVLSQSGEGVVGYARWDYFWDTIPLCVMIRVEPQHQRRGVGRQLFRCIEETFRQRGHSFWLSSTDETNADSQRFHESYGFRQIGALTGLGQDAREIFYRKDIS